MKESRLRTNIVKALTNYGGFWTVVHQTQYGQTGLPDIIGCYQGQFYGIEVKVPGREHTLTVRQARVLRLIKRAGGHATMVSSVDDAMHFVFGGPH